MECTRGALARCYATRVQHTTVCIKRKNELTLTLPTFTQHDQHVGVGANAVYVCSLSHWRHKRAWMGSMRVPSYRLTDMSPASCARALPAPAPAPCPAPARLPATDAVPARLPVYELPLPMLLRLPAVLRRPRRLARGVRPVWRWRDTAGIFGASGAILSAHSSSFCRRCVLRDTCGFFFLPNPNTLIMPDTAVPARDTTEPADLPLRAEPAEYPESAVVGRSVISCTLYSLGGVGGRKTFLV